MDQMARDATIGVKVEPAVKALLEKAAAEDGRTLSNLMERLALNYLRERGYLK
jgi:uncharacterized protein (DUF1778 family)